MILNILMRKYVDNGNEIKIENIDSLDDIKVNDEASLSIDGSTTNTGIAIIREIDGKLLYTISVSRGSAENAVKYKVNLKKVVYKLFENNRSIKKVYYEEPFLGYVASAVNLLMLRTFVEELIIENEPELNYIKHVEISNKKWKKIFLYPDKCVGNSQLEKEMVRDKAISYIPCLMGVTQDEIDAFAMGYSAVVLMQGNGDELKSKKKSRGFKYNIRFIGANEDEDALAEFFDIYDGDKKLLENGIKFITINSKSNFNEKVYEAMGDEDKIIIAKFSSNSHGNIILEHKIGHLAMSYKYIYAIIWRKTRKRS
ncbi:MAG: hypothetical protein QXD03_02635 [Candidatus Anstonellales archaeon]